LNHRKQFPFFYGFGRKDEDGGCETAVVAETDPRGEQSASQEHPGSAGTGRVCDDAKVGGGTSGATGDFPEKIFPYKRRRVNGAFETIHAATESIEFRFRSGRHGVDPVFCCIDPKRQPALRR